MIRRRIFLAVLTFCVIFQYTPILSSAENTTADNNTAKTAYEILQFVGLMPADTDYEQIKNNTLKRGDFAVYLAAMFNMSGLAAAEIFSDVDNGTPEGRSISALASVGILRGYSDGTFRPGLDISTEEMVIASMRALGYTEYKNWNTDNYIKKADEIDILDNISLGKTASMSDCIVLLYNVLHTNAVSMYMDGKAIRERETESPLESTYKLKYVKGQITANAFAAFEGERTDSRNRIKIDGRLYYTNVPEIGDWLGYNVIAYYSADDNDESIYYFVPDVKNKTVVITHDEFDSYSNNTIRYFDNEKLKQLRLSNDVVIIKNSRLVETDYASALDIDYGTITCISVKDEYSVVIIEAYENYIVTAVDVSKKVIYTDRTDENGKSVTIDLENCDYMEFVTIPYGKSVNENTIAADDLISVSMSDDKRIIKGYLCMEQVTGTIEASSTGGEITYTISGTEYKVDPNFNEKNKLSAGDSGIFLLDIGGRIAAYSVNKQQTEKIGYLYMMYKNDYEDAVNAKIYTTSREHLELQLADRVKFNGGTVKAVTAQSALCTNAGATLKRQLIAFKLNSEGKISSITTAAEDKESRKKDNTLYTLLPKGSYYWYYQMKSFDRKYILSKNTYYMRVPAENASVSDTTLFGCQPFSNVTWYNSNGSKYILGLYKFNDDSPFADILLVSNTDGSTLTTTTELTMVSSVSLVEGSDGEIVTAVHGYRRGSEVTAYIPADVYNNDIEEGDLIRFATNVRGYVGQYEIVYDQSEDKVMWNQGSTADEYSNNTSTPAASLRYTFGYVNDLYLAPYTNGLNSVIQIGKNPGETDDIYQMDTNTSANTRYIIYDSSREKDKVYMGRLNEIVSYKDCQDADETTRVFVHTRSGWLIAVMIYK